MSRIIARMEELCNWICYKIIPRKVKGTRQKVPSLWRLESNQRPASSRPLSSGASLERPLPAELRHTRQQLSCDFFEVEPDLFHVESFIHHESLDAVSGAATELRHVGPLDDGATAGIKLHHAARLAGNRVAQINPRTELDIDSHHIHRMQLIGFVVNILPCVSLVAK